MKLDEIRHELIIPNEDIPFKLFLFEGKDGNYFRDYHWHESLEIFAILEGEIDFSLNENRIHLNAGQFILVNSNEIHAIHALRPNRIVVLQIPVSHFRRYYQEESYICFLHNRPDMDGQVMALIREMFDTYQEKAQGYELIVQSMFYHLLYLLVRQYRRTDTDRDIMMRSRNRNKLSRITDYIKDNYNKEITLAHLGSVFGYSPAYISRMFQKYAGYGFKKYLDNVRLEHAIQDLEQSGDTLDVIAVRHGFPDRKALTKVFQQQYQTSPGSFRRKRN